MSSPTPAVDQGRAYERDEKSSEGKYLARKLSAAKDLRELFTKRGDATGQKTKQRLHEHGLFKTASVLSANLSAATVSSSDFRSKASNHSEEPGNKAVDESSASSATH